MEMMKFICIDKVVAARSVRILSSYWNVRLAI